MAGEQAAKTALESVLEWSAKRPLWQQDALRRIVSGGRVSDADLLEIVALCKQGHGGLPAKVAALALGKDNLPAKSEAAAPVALLAVSDVEGANALAPGQRLVLEAAGLTIIYGDNGAGKSGYARILKRVCRARHSAEIQGNIYAARAPGGRAKAVLEYSVGAQKQEPAKWVDQGKPHPVLSAISVFDSECAAVHIGSKNEVAFRPFGLDVPDELAGCCVRMKEVFVREKQQLERARNAVFQRPPWSPQTTVGTQLAQLSAASKLADLRALALLSEAEQGRLEQLKQDLGKDPAKAAAEQVVKANNVKGIISEVQRLAALTSNAALEGIHTQAKEAVARRASAQAAADRAFAGEQLAGIGTEAWRGLWEAARRYSVEAAYCDLDFPHVQDGAVCLLCQQPLAQEAGDRLARFEQFVKEDTERLAAAAEVQVKRLLGQLAAQNINTRPIAANLRELSLSRAELARQTRRYMAAARQRRRVLLLAVTGGKHELLLSPLPVDPVTTLTQVEAEIRKYAEDLRRSAQAEERKKLEAELAGLADRATLGNHLDVVAEEIARLNEIRILDLCIEDSATNAVTKFGNDLADSVITPQLRDRFQQEITRLAADKVRVEIVRSGGKLGAPQYQVRFFAKPDAKVIDVLSEGEKTCVALAAFMTELATATNNSALVFDDPVSSLDHRWRRQVARRLVEEVTLRQVIVFTHDLVFVNDLIDASRGSAKLITLSRDQTGPGVVAEGLPWVAKSVEDRLDKLEKDARLAKQLHDSNDEERYRHAAVRHYNLLRATWERAIEEVAFFKIVRRHRDYIDTKELKKASVLSEADCDAFQAGFKKCCDVTDAHDPSVGRNAEPPPPGDLIADVEALKKWVASIREKQKLIKA